MSADNTGSSPVKAGDPSACSPRFSGIHGFPPVHVSFDLRPGIRGEKENGRRWWGCVTVVENDGGAIPFAGSEPTFLNHHAWAVRWQDRAKSVAMAQAVLEFSRAAGKARSLGARRRNGLAMRTLAWQARWRGDLESAESLAHRAIARLKDEGADSAIADVLATLSAVHCCRGRRDLARECIEQGLEALASQPNVETRIDLLCVQAMIERQARRMRAAQSTLREAVSLSSRSERAQTEQSVARTLLMDDNPGEALEHAKTAIAKAREHSNRIVLPYALEAAAAAHIELGHTRRAEELIGEGEELAIEDGDRRARTHLGFQRARLAERQGDLESALRLSLEGQDAARVFGYSQLQKRFLDRTAALQEALGQTAAALNTLKQAISVRDAERE